MLQHAVGSGLGLAGSTQSSSDKQNNFVASHSPYFLPGVTLKKIAIAEMRHAEAISERIVQMGEKPTAQPANVTLDNTIPAVLENDREQENGAIELYKTIITLAGNEQDDLTVNLFKNILLDEERHHRTFSVLIG